VTSRGANDDSYKVMGLR